MIRTLISWLVLVLIPAISLGFAIVPYVWVKRYKHPVLWKHLWAAFFIGLAGNLAWWLMLFHLQYSVIVFINGVDTEGFLLSVIVVSVFNISLPFLFTKIKGIPFSLKRIALCLFLSVLIIIVEISLLAFLLMLAMGYVANSFNSVPFDALINKKIINSIK